MAPLPALAMFRPFWIRRCSITPNYELTWYDVIEVRVDCVDAWSVRAEWRSASSVNGPIERYLLYVSTDVKSLGEIFYNSSQLLLFHTITNLTAATQYFVRLAVSSRSKVILTGIGLYNGYYVLLLMS